MGLIQPVKADCDERVGRLNVHVQAAGSIVVAQRAIDELEQRLLEQREVLAHTEQVNEAKRRLAARVGERDAAAGEVAHTIAQLLSNLDELAAARDAVTAASEAVRDVSGRGELRDAPPEPDAFRGSWERLVERIRSDLGEELENDLVEAAARSPEGYAIKDLPAHLRVLATERRRALFKRRFEDDTTVPGSPSSSR